MQNAPLPVALDPLLRASSLRVEQEAHVTEALLGVERRNRYRVIDEEGRTFLEATENGAGVGAFFLRQFMGSRRSFEMDLTTPSGGVMLRLRRPFTWFFSEMDIVGWDGRPLGSVQQRWQWFARRLDLLSPSGRLLAFLHGPFFKPWTFQLVHAGRQVGRIEKQWSGFVKEAMTTADNFRLTFSTEVGADLRQLTLAAAFLVDFVYFERRQGSGGGMRWLSND